MKKFILRILLIIFCTILVVGGIFVFNGYQLYKNAIETVSLSDKIGQVKSNKSYIKLSDLPSEYKDAVISVEDRRFYEHGPVDFIAILRATFTNLKNQQFLEGGSTITQQVAKNLYFMSPDENVAIRKVAEIFMSYDLEKVCDNKDDILELYMNTIYFGEGYYGIQEACKGYLKKDAKDMTLFESTMMAGIPNAPSVYAPTINMDLTLSRQKKVISTTVENNYISQEKADELINSQTNFKLPKQ